MTTIIDKLSKSLRTVEAQLAKAESASDVESVRVSVFGRKGLIPTLGKEMKSVPASDRPAVGKAFNEAKTAFQSMLDNAKSAVTGEGDGDGESRLDVSLPGRRPRLGQKHPISIVIEDCCDIFRRMGFVVVSGPEIETVHNNFDALNTPDDHPSRDEQDTFYFEDGRLLRTQTSPVQIRVMERSEPPVRIVAPGRCYRRDTPDATHSMNFHQIEGLYIDENVSLADLKGALLTFGGELFGKRVGVRLRPHFFPFTEPSVECDFSCILCEGAGCRVCKNSGWLEIAGAGMVDPNVLGNVGYDQEKWTGFAFGMGIERIAMIRYRINDIRLLYENDMRFLRQF